MGALSAAAAAAAAWGSGDRNEARGSPSLADSPAGEVLCGVAGARPGMLSGGCWVSSLIYNDKC